MSFWIYFSVGFFGSLVGDALGLKGWKNWLFVVTIALAVALLSLPKPAEASDPSALLRINTAHLSNGTGFVLEVRGKTYLVSNYHVCLQGSWQGVLTGSLETGEVVRGRIAKSSIGPDLCAARIPPRSSPIHLADSLSKGDDIYTRGYPYGVLSQSHGRYVGRMKWSYIFPIEEIGQCPKPSKAVRSGPGTIAGCEMEYTDNLTDVYARPGSSGSPVVNTVGDLVGVMSSWYGGRDAGGMVKLEDVKEFFKEL